MPLSSAAACWALEAAWELKKAGLSVTVLEAAPMLMGRQLDATAGSILEEISRKKRHCHPYRRLHLFYRRRRVKRCKRRFSFIRRDIPGRSCHRICRCPRQLQAWLRKWALKQRRRIVVNSRMETGMKHVYACGDCAEYKGANFAIWPEASEQGRVAGANAAGR